MSNKTKSTLYDITEEFEALESMLFDDDGEIIKEQEQLTTYIKNLLSTKTDGCIGYVQHLQDEIETIKKKENGLKKIKKQKEREIESFKNQLRFCLKKMGVGKIKGTFGYISMMKKLKTVETIDILKVPIDYRNQRISMSVKYHKVLKALKEGIKISGCKLGIQKEETISVIDKSRNKKEEGEEENAKNN